MQIAIGRQIMNSKYAFSSRCARHSAYSECYERFVAAESFHLINQCTNAGVDCYARPNELTVNRNVPSTFPLLTNIKFTKTDASLAYARVFIEQLNFEPAGTLLFSAPRKALKKTGNDYRQHGKLKTGMISGVP